MDATEKVPRKDLDTLASLDQAASHVIEARVCLMRLAPDEREDLRVLTDGLLAAIGQRIAALLPPPARASDR